MAFRICLAKKDRGGLAKEIKYLNNIKLKYTKKISSVPEFVKEFYHPKTLKEIIESDRLSFGSADRLFQHLGVFPGAVSPFCMLNGIKKNVKFFCDFDLKNFKNIYLHPFVNDRSICMSINDLEKFLKRYDISINWENL